MSLDKTRQKALFWSVPEDVLENPDFATWRTKTILCEGLAGDISLLDKQHIEQALAQRFLPVRIKKLWSEYFESEAERKESDMKLTALQKKTLKIFSRVNKHGDFYFTGVTSATGSRMTWTSLPVNPLLSTQQRGISKKLCVQRG